MSILIKRFFLVCSLLALSVSAVLAEGEYQRTKDGKTTIWNNEPKAGDEATWSGDRDGEGYATGFGTLTWYTGEKQKVKHLGIPMPDSDVYARYFGYMVRGKFSGEVNVHSKGKTDHALFVDGRRTSRWRAGKAPTRNNIALTNQRTKEKTAAEPRAPAEGPRVTRVAKVKETAKRPETEQKAPSKPSSETAPSVASVQRPTDEKPVAEPAPVVKTPPSRSSPKPPSTSKKSQVEVEDSLRELVGPPSSLHAAPDSPPSGEVSSAPRLTSEDVVNLADAEARTRGVNPGQFQRGNPQYISKDQVWSLSYDQSVSEGSEEPARRFNVTIDDKTKGIIFAPGK